LMKKTLLNGCGSFKRAMFYNAKLIARFNGH